MSIVQNMAVRETIFTSPEIGCMNGHIHECIYLFLKFLLICINIEEIVSIKIEILQFQYVKYLIL